MDLVDDVKDELDKVTDDAENKFHEMKGEVDGYQKGRDDSSNEKCNCGKEGCMCAAGECNC